MQKFFKKSPAVDEFFVKSAHRRGIFVSKKRSPQGKIFQKSPAAGENFSKNHAPQAKFFQKSPAAGEIY